jgi:tryptophan 2,3-dioxygenase
MELRRASDGLLLVRPDDLYNFSDWLVRGNAPEKETITGVLQTMPFGARQNYCEVTADFGHSGGTTSAMYREIWRLRMRNQHLSFKDPNGRTTQVKVMGSVEPALETAIRTRSVFSVRFTLLDPRPLW